MWLPEAGLGLCQLPEGLWDWEGVPGPQQLG